MAAQMEPSLTFEDIPAGSLFRASSASTVNFIFLGIAYGNAIILREKVSGSAIKIASASAYPATYVDSLVDQYLSNDVYNAFSDNMRGLMADATISCVTYNGSVSSTETITRKIFALSAAEVSTTFIDALKAYYNTTSDNTARIAKKADDTAVAWWLRDARTAGTQAQIKTVTTSGAVAQTGENAGSTYARAAISMVKSTPLALENGVYIPK